MICCTDMNRLHGVTIIKVYVDLASQDRERYEQEMNSYQHQHLDVVEGHSPPAGVRTGSVDLAHAGHEHTDKKAKISTDAHKNGNGEDMHMVREEDEAEVDELMEDE